MPADKPGSNRETRGTGVSLFRSGQSLPGPALPQDVINRRDDRASRLPPIFADPARIWDSLGTVTLPAAPLAQKGVFLDASNHPAAVAFDILRTRLLHGLAEKNWHRIAVTSPTHGCGKSFVATNLALSLARRPSSRTVLVDLDLRHPEIARLLNIDEDRPLAEYLSGEQPLESNFRRFGRTLALGLNGAPIEKASETLHDPATFSALAGIVDLLDPEVILYDMPPILVSDDVMAMSPSVDAVLLVTDGTKSSPDEIRAAEKMLEGRIPLLGVVLNRAQDFSAGRYRYAKK